MSFLVVQAGMFFSPILNYHLALISGRSGLILVMMLSWLSWSDLVQTIPLLTTEKHVLFSIVTVLLDISLWLNFMPNKNRRQDSPCLLIVNLSA